MQSFTSLVLTTLLLISTAMAGTPNEKLLEACRQSNLKAAEKALTAGADANGLDAEGKSMLANAFFSPEVTKLLLSKGGDPNGGKYPAIINAANNYSTEVVTLLLAAGADPNLPGILVSPHMETIWKSIRDMEALAASAKGKTKAMYEETIANMKAQYGDGSNGGLTVYALNQAVQATNCVAIIEALLAAGAKHELVPGTPIMHVYAAYGQSPAERKAGFSQGVSAMEGFGFKVPNWYGNLADAINQPTEAVAAALAKAGANVNALNGTGNTPLHTALAGGVGNKPEVQLGLINNGADISIEDPKFGKCFTLAAKTGLIPVVDAMLAKGADMEETSKIFDATLGQNLNGVTPLIAATMHGHTPMVKHLVSKGAKIKEDAEGLSFSVFTGCATRVNHKSALFFAIDLQHMELIKYFVDESGLNWNRSIVINQVKKTSISQLGNVTVTTTSCLSDGSYSPSVYAKKMSSKKIAGYLKGKGL